MSADSIQIKLKDRSDSRGNTFDGVTLNFAPSIKVLEITDIRVKRTRKAADDPGAISQPIFNDPSKFIFNGRSIQLRIGRQEFIAVNFIREVSEAEFNATASPEMIEFRKVLLGSIGSDLKGIAESEKMKQVVSNTSSYNTAGEIKNGIQGLQEGAKPTLNFAKRPRIVKLMPGAADGSADKVDSLKNELSSLFQKSNMKSSGNLNKSVFSFGSTSSIFNVFKKHTSLPESKIKNECEKVLPSNITPKVLSTAKKALEDKAVNITPSDNIFKAVKKEVEINLPEVNFAGLNFDKAGIIPGAGRSGANAFAQGLAKVKGIIGDFLGDVTEKIPGVPKGVKIPEGKTVPNLIEGVQDLTCKLSLNTNVSKFLPKGKLTPNMFPTNIKKVSSTPTSFNGSQSSNHEFEFCDTSDELLDELANSDRLNSTNEKALTVVVVSYLGDDLYGLPDKMNAKILQEVSLESDKQTIINEAIANGKSPTQAREEADKQFSSPINSKKYGIQPHYLILTDGRIQRGRPVGRTRAPGRDQYFNNGLEISFVAGEKNPVNAEQSASFEAFLQKILKIAPALNVFGDNEIDTTLRGPGFDIGAVRQKFEIDFKLIEDPASLLNSKFTRKALSIVLPSSDLMPKPVLTQLQKKINDTNPENITKKFETKDPLTGEEIKEDIDAGIEKFGDIMNKLKTGELDLTDNINAAANESFAAAKKGFADLNIKNITVQNDKLNGQVNDFIKKAKPGTATEAQRIAGIFD